MLSLLFNHTYARSLLALWTISRNLRWLETHYTNGSLMSSLVLSSSPISSSSFNHLSSPSHLHVVPVLISKLYDGHSLINKVEYAGKASDASTKNSKVVDGSLIGRRSALDRYPTAVSGRPVEAHCVPKARKVIERRLRPGLSGTQTRPIQSMMSFHLSDEQTSGRPMRSGKDAEIRFSCVH